MLHLGSDFCIQKDVLQYMQSTAEPEQWVEYTYKICFDAGVTQIEKRNGKEIVLGRIQEGWRHMVLY